MALTVDGQIGLDSAFPHLMYRNGSVSKYLYGEEYVDTPSTALNNALGTDGMCISYPWLYWRYNNSVTLRRKFVAVSDTSGVAGGMVMVNSWSKPRFYSSTHRYETGRYFTLFFSDSPTYNVGQEITFSVETSQAGYMALKSKDQNGTEYVLIGPGSSVDTSEYLNANTTYYYAPSGAQYEFVISPPRGYQTAWVELYSNSSYTNLIDTEYINFEVV